jgi:predicted site-specific integrase-resolvase
MSTKGEVRMSLVKTWYDLATAADKYGVSKELILQWVEEGRVRHEREGERVVRVNIDDLALQVDEMIHKR